jgi:hypothetical protein
MPILIFFLVACAEVAFAAKPEVDFTSNRDGTSTLTITCTDGKTVPFTVDNKRLDMMDIDAIYTVLWKECGLSREKED